MLLHVNANISGNLSSGDVANNHVMQLLNDRNVITMLDGLLIMKPPDCFDH